MRHLVSIRDLDREALLRLVTNASSFVEISKREIKKVPSLRGKTVINLFLENSTRTRASFEIAGKRLSADTINISGAGSSISKGESLEDTAKTLQAMQPDVLVVRHSASGAALFMSQKVDNCAVINAGDGMHEHPSQALLDLLAIFRRRSELKKPLDSLRVAIVGDILHSRVARSLIWAHEILGNSVHLVGPSTLVPEELASPAFASNCKIFRRLEEGIEGCDIVTTLRVQKERMGDFFFSDLREYTREYGLNARLFERLAPEALIMHPGPVNRGVEIDTASLLSPNCLVEEQVELGVALRMALLFEYGTQSAMGQEDLQPPELKHAV